MQRISTVTLTPADAFATGYAQAQAKAAAGDLTLNGALAGTADLARRVAITSAGNDSARSFTIYGTDRNGQTISETLAGANAGVATSLKDFKTVTRIAIDGAAAGNVSAGTSAKLSSAWLPMDRYNSLDVGFAAIMAADGDVTYTVEHTLDDPFSAGVGVLSGPIDLYLTPFPHASIAAQNTSKDGSYSTPITAIRVTITAFSNGKSLRFQAAPGFSGGR